MPFITAHCVSPALPHPTYWGCTPVVKSQRMSGLKKRAAVGKTYPAVEETSPAVDVFSHGIYFPRGG